MPSLSNIIGQASRGADLYFVFRFLRLLTMKYTSTNAYKLGIIDKKGKALKKSADLETIKEKSSYTMLHRMVFKIRGLIEKVPLVGKSILLNYAAALFLLKEQKDTRIWNDDGYMKSKLLEFLDTDWEADAKFLKEEVDNMNKKSFKSFLSENKTIEESQELQAMMALDDAGIEAVINKKGQVVIAKKDLKNAEKAFKKSFRKGGAPELKLEGIDIEKADMKDVIKDFQSSDAPQFKGKSDKKKKEMAIAAKLSKEEFEITESGHTDVASAKNQVKVAKSALQKMEMELSKLPDEGSLPSWWTNKVAIAVDKLDGMADYLDTQVEEVTKARKIKKEGTAEFMAAASAAKKEGKKKFKFGGKEYPVTIKVDIPLANEEIELGEGLFDKIKKLVKGVKLSTMVYNIIEKGEGLEQFIKEIEPTITKEKLAGFIKNIENTKLIDVRRKSNAKMLISALNKINIKEEIANSVGGGGIAGLDTGLTAKKKKDDTDKAKRLRKQYLKGAGITEEVQRTTFAGKDVFIVDSDTFHNCRMGKKQYGRYETYVGNGLVGQTIREYGLKYPRRPIILQNGDSGPMLYLKYGRS